MQLVCRMRMQQCWLVGMSLVRLMMRRLRQLMRMHRCPRVLTRMLTAQAERWCAMPSAKAQQIRCRMPTPPVVALGSRLMEAWLIKPVLLQRPSHQVSTVDLLRPQLRRTQRIVPCSRRKTRRPWLGLKARVSALKAHRQPVSITRRRRQASTQRLDLWVSRWQHRPIVHRSRVWMPQVQPVVSRLTRQPALPVSARWAPMALCPRNPSWDRAMMHSPRSLVSRESAMTAHE